MGWKDRTVELADISKAILDQRIQNKDCAKCGRGNHMWYACTNPKNTGTPTSNNSNATNSGNSGSNNSGHKRTKISGVSTVAPQGRIQELEDSDEEMFD